MSKDWLQYRVDKNSNKKDWLKYKVKDTEPKEDEEESYLSKLPRNVAAGLAEMGHGLLNTPHNTVESAENALQKIGSNFKGFGGVDFGNESKSRLSDFIPKQEEHNFAQMLGQKGEGTLADRLTQGLFQYAPALGLGAEIAPQALFGATQNKNPGVGAAEGAIGSVAGNLLGKGIEKGINALRPTKMFKSPLSKKELAQSFNQVKDTNTDLGNAIQNPKLQRLYENVLPKYNGEASSLMQKTGQQIVEKGEDILKNLLGNNSAENVPAQLTKKLTDSFKTHQKFKNDIYNAVDDLAQNEGLKLELPSFAHEAKKYMEAIEGTNILKHEPDAKKILSKLINYKNPVKETKTQGLLVDKAGKPLLNETKTEYPTLKEANILKGKLGQYAKSYGQSSDADQRHMAGIFRNLAARLKNDIRDSIDKSGNETLKKGYDAAEENYAKNFSPFLDKDVYKFISGKSDPETIISKFITNSRTSDLGRKLSSLSEKLSKPKGAQGSEESNLLAYGYLSRALDNEGNFNPAKFATSIKQLGPNQLKALFPDKAIRKEVLNYKALVNKNPRSLQVMFNPLTGQVNSDIAPHALANIVGGIAGLASGGPPGAIIGAASGPLIQSKVAKMVTKKLTDPVYRRKFINALIANKEYSHPKINEVLQKGSSISAGLSGNDKKQTPLEIEVIKKRR